jgi:predicted SnoaL-like aldol condensation-catalyzing enzyme
MNMPDLKAIATRFLTHAASGRVAEAYSAHISPEFRHHNPWFAGDAASLQKGMQESAQQTPNKLFEIQHTLQEGNLVAVHSRLRQSTAGTEMEIAVVHLFRFEGDQIAEFWDVAQVQPAEMVNQYGMF